MKKNIIILLILALILPMGCSINKDTKKDIGVEGELVDISVEVSAEDNIIIERSEILSDYVVELYGIDDTGTIIFNDIALVAVVMAYDAELTEDTKELIKKIVMEKDSEIKTVIVSEDEKTFNNVVDIIIDLMHGITYDSQVGKISKLIEKAK